MSYHFHPAAEAEYLESIAYLESKRPGLGASFMAEFERLMKRVCEAPHHHPVARAPDLRRARMARFPYTLLFRETGDSIQLLAVAHHRRRPNYWLGRV